MHLLSEFKLTFQEDRTPISCFSHLQSLTFRETRGTPPFFCFTNLSKHIFQEAPIMHLPSEFTLPLPGGQKNLLMLLLSELTLLPESQMTPFAFLPSLLALTFQEARGSLLYISHLSKHLSSSRPLSCISHLISPSGVPFCVSPI